MCAPCQVCQLCHQPASKWNKKLPPEVGKLPPAVELLHNTKGNCFHPWWKDFLKLKMSKIKNACTVQKSSAFCHTPRTAEQSKKHQCLNADVSLYTLPTQHEIDALHFQKVLFTAPWHQEHRSALQSFLQSPCVTEFHLQWPCQCSSNPNCQTSH